MSLVHTRYYLLVTLFISCFSCNSPDKNELHTKLNEHNGLNVGFVVVDGVFNSELVAPMDIFHHTVFHTDPGMKVFTVAPEMNLITTFEGLRLMPDFTFDSAPRIDVLVVPSADGSMTSDLDNLELIDFVKNQGQNAKYVMSLCDGAFVLAKAGLVNDKESTTFPNDIGAYKEMFPELKVHEGVSFVHDGSLITSAGGASSYDPAMYMVELLYGNQAAKGVAEGMVIDWDVSTIPHIVVE